MPAGSWRLHKSDGVVGTSLVIFVLAGVTLLLSGFGLWHYRRVPVEEEIPQFAGTAPIDHKLAPSPS